MIKILVIFSFFYLIISISQTKKSLFPVDIFLEINQVNKTSNVSTDNLTKFSLNVISNFTVNSTSNVTTNANSNITKTNTKNGTTKNGQNFSNITTFSGTLQATGLPNMTWYHPNSTTKNPKNMSLPLNTTNTSSNIKVKSKGTLIDYTNSIVILIILFFDYN